MEKLPHTPDRQINPDEKDGKQLFHCGGTCKSMYTEEEMEDYLGIKYCVRTCLPKVIADDVTETNEKDNNP